MRYELREKSCILFAIITFLFSLGTILTAASGLMHFLYLKFHILYLLLLIISAILLLSRVRKIVLFGWALASFSSIVYLFNPYRTVPDLSYSAGSLVMSYQSLLAGDSLSMLIGMNNSIVPVIMVVFAVLGLNNYKNKEVDTLLAALFVGVSCLSRFFVNFLVHRVHLSAYYDAILFAVIFVVSYLVWTRLDK